MRLNLQTTRPITRDNILSMVRTVRQQAEVAAEAALEQHCVDLAEWALECGRQEGRSKALEDVVALIEQTKGVDGELLALMRRQR